MYKYEGEKLFGLNGWEAQWNGVESHSVLSIYFPINSIIEVAFELSNSQKQNLDIREIDRNETKTNLVTSFYPVVSKHTVL